MYFWKLQKTSFFSIKNEKILWHHFISNTSPYRRVHQTQFKKAAMAASAQKTDIPTMIKMHLLKDGPYGLCVDITMFFCSFFPSSTRKSF